MADEFWTPHFRPRTHNLKLERRFADAVLDGRKCFEIRFNDRHFNIGEHIKFVVVDNDSHEPTEHPLNDATYRIDYILRDTHYGLNDGYVAFTIKRIDNAEVHDENEN